MLLHRSLSVLGIAAVLSATGGQPWKDKAPSDWTDDDAREILSDSPWAKTVHPYMENSNNGQRPRRSSGPGVGIGVPGIGIGVPGGMGRYPGGGYPGGSYPGGPNGGGNPDYEAPPVLKVRWESAQPIREAELKIHETNAPSVDESHYAIAVYGVPDRMLNADAKALGDRLKKQASLKLDGNRDLKPSAVEILRREDGPVVVYLFPRTTEITQKDKRIEFTAKIQRLQSTQPFYVDDMAYRGKLEL